MVHRQLGYQQLQHVTALLGDFANVENPPRMEGRFLSMILVPNREAIAMAERARAAAKLAEESTKDESSAASKVAEEEIADESAAVGSDVKT